MLNIAVVDGAGDGDEDGDGDGGGDVAHALALALAAVVAAALVAVELFNEITRFASLGPWATGPPMEIWISSRDKHMLHLALTIISDWRQPFPLGHYPAISWTSYGVVQTGSAFQ